MWVNCVYYPTYSRLYILGKGLLKQSRHRSPRGLKNVCFLKGKQSRTRGVRCQVTSLESNTRAHIRGDAHGGACPNNMGGSGKLLVGSKQGLEIDIAAGHDGSGV
jgi:hypothetical protein